MYRNVSLLLLAYISMLSLSACRGDTPDEKKRVVKTYSSPTEVFDAYRQADQSGDWRTFYFLCTPEVQRELVFQTQFACLVAEKVPAVSVIQKQFGPTEAEYGRRYYEAYKRKHGHAEVIDRFLATAIPYWESKEKEAGGGKTGRADTVPPPPEVPGMDALPEDEELSRQAVYDATKDKVAFFVGVQELDRKRRKPDIVGDLAQVTITGDTATGRAKITIVHQPGESPRQPGQAPPVYDKPFKFRRINGSWLLDSL